MILVHGAWHGSWCWASVTPHLAARGIPSVGVDLAGHGLNGRPPFARSARPFDPAALATELSPVASVSVRDAAEALVDRIRLAGNGEPCVVVAHSLGGVIATAAAELAPELFAHLVYLSAYVPVTASVAELAASDHSFDRVLVADPAHAGQPPLRLPVPPGGAGRGPRGGRTGRGPLEPLRPTTAPEPQVPLGTALSGARPPRKPGINSRAALREALTDRQRMTPAREVRNRP
ncbi:alpha/beta hydrolase [Streptosporangium sp. NPDC002721]|uniref:alpha/beta hydrolase n=1 Tax=Streptosporangium sp. NPDC002721 TaxID=3366188 RepID=UPI0036AA4257